MLNDDDVREFCRKLKPVIGKKADSLWILYLSEDEKRRREFALDIQLIAEKYLAKEEKQILLSPPSEEDAFGDLDALFNTYTSFLAQGGKDLLTNPSHSIQLPIQFIYDMVNLYYV